MKRKMILLTVLLLLSGFSALGGPEAAPTEGLSDAAEGTPLEAADTWQTVCTSDRLSLSVHARSGSFLLTDRQSGQEWRSVPEGAEQDTVASGVYKMELLSNLVVYGRDLEQNKEFKRNSETASVRKQGASVVLRDNGFTVTYRFPAEGWSIPVRVELREDHLEVTVETAAMAEEQADRYRILSLRLLPYFGAAGLSEEGYFLLPDGSGSLMRFNNGRYLNEEYAVPFYGRDASQSLQVKNTEEQAACLPVYGIRKERGGLLAVVAQGAETGVLHAQPNRSTSEWASVYCEFRLRPSDVFVMDADSGLPQSVTLYYDGEPQTEACQLLLYPLDAEENDYAGMARRLRRYWAETMPSSETASMPGVYVDLYGAVRRKESFLGVPVERTRVLSEVGSAAALLQSLTESGITGVRMRYRSWSSDGLAGKAEKSLSPVRGLGSRKELLALQEQLAAQGGRLYLEAEIQTVDRGGNGVSGFFDISRSLSNAPAYQYEFPLSTGLRKTNGKRGLLVSPAQLPTLSGRLFERAAAEGFSGLSLGTLSHMLYEDYSDAVMATRTRSLGYAEKALAAKTDGAALLADAPNGYVLPAADEAVNLPSGSSRYDVTDESVPFLQLALSGRMAYALSPVNLSADPRDCLLTALETGAGLHYALLTGDPRLVMGTDLNDLTSASAEYWLPILREQYAEASAVWEQVGAAAMYSHERLAEHVTRTLYENGVAVYVNRGAEAATAAGVTVPARGYTVRREGVNP